MEIILLFTPVKQNQIDKLGVNWEGHPTSQAEVLNGTPDKTSGDSYHPLFVHNSYSEYGSSRCIGTDLVR